jgi:FkbM family methyltransferase
MDRLQLLTLGLKHAVNYRGLGDYHARQLFLLLARRYAQRIMLDTESGRLYVDPRDTGIVPALVYWNRSPDSQMLEYVCRLLPTLSGGQATGGTFVDIGANVGTTSIAALTQYGFSHAIAFEPNMDNFVLLQQNIAANGLTDRVVPLQSALSDTEGEVLMERSQHNMGDHRIRVQGDARTEVRGLYAEDTRPTQRVPCTQFDTLVERGTIALEQVSLVWMDVQGHEAHVLRGARSLLESPIPVVTEFWPYGLRRAGSLQTMQDLIAKYYTHIVDIRRAQDGQQPGRSPLLPASAIAQVAPHYKGTKATDLLLLKRP